MVKGDGHIRKTTGQINYWTASKKLADDLQEIILKLGWLGTSTAQEKKVLQIKGRKVKAGIIYAIGVQKTRHYRLRKNNPQKIYYKGRVYCCEVENHTVFVRRNGRVSWCGNSIGVVTINLPQIGYLSKTKKEFFERLAYLMELAKNSLEIKRKTLDNFIERGLYPYSRHYLESVKKMRGTYWGNHFSTIGLIGMNECLLNFIDKDITTLAGQKFAGEVLDFMRERLIKYQQETGNLYNLEATPAEGISYRLSHLDRAKFPDIITAGEKEPYYTNSSQLPVGWTDDLFKALDLQDKLQTKYTGGTVFHAFLGERINDPEMVKILLKKIFTKYQLPYLTFTPTFSICPNHGYIPGEHFTCPRCLIHQPCEVYSRIVGYIRPVQQWHLSKQEEFRERKEFKI
jgi:ribonucleoside-triphosphate reductase